MQNVHFDKAAGSFYHLATKLKKKLNKTINILLIYFYSKIGKIKQPMSLKFCTNKLARLVTFIRSATPPQTINHPFTNTNTPPQLPHPQQSYHHTTPHHLCNHHHTNSIPTTTPPPSQPQSKGETPSLRTYPFNV